MSSKSPARVMGNRAMMGKAGPVPSLQSQTLTEPFPHSTTLSGQTHPLTSASPRGKASEDTPSVLKQQ